MRTVRIVVSCLLGSCVTAPLSPTQPSLHVARGAALIAPLPPVNLPFAPRASAVRAAGGFYALGNSGVLARMDRRGRLTGIFETELTSLATTRDFLCGIDASGRVLCARDHRQDATCASAGLSPFHEVALRHVPRATLASRGAGRALCVERDGKALACISGESRCGRICLAFPACAPPRCVDPCPPGRVL